MTQTTRYAIYYAPRPGLFADRAADWLGWDPVSGEARVQPFPELAALTDEPRRYGFHGTLKAPFRLAEGHTLADLSAGLATLAARLGVVDAGKLTLTRISQFLALVPGEVPALQDLASEVVRDLDRFRAPLTEAEIARRKPDALSERQQRQLAEFGYPYIFQDFRFHLTLSNALAPDALKDLQMQAESWFAPVLPEVFRIKDLCLFAQEAGGNFRLIGRHALTG